MYQHYSQLLTTQCTDRSKTKSKKTNATGSRIFFLTSHIFFLASFFSLFSHSLHLLTQHLPIFQLCVYIFPLQLCIYYIYEQSLAWLPALCIYYIYMNSIISMTSSFVCIYIYMNSIIILLRPADFFLLVSIQTVGHSTGKESMCYLSGISIQHHISVWNKIKKVWKRERERGGGGRKKKPIFMSRQCEMVRSKASDPRWFEYCILLKSVPTPPTQKGKSTAAATEIIKQ